MKAIAAAAHARGMTVTGHIPEGMTAIEGVNDGMDQINHITYEWPYFARIILGPDGKPDRSKAPVPELNGPRVNDLISTLQSHHTVLDPTMALYEMFLNTKPLEQVELSPSPCGRNSHRCGHRSGNPRLFVASRT